MPIEDTKLKHELVFILLFIYKNQMKGEKKEKKTQNTISIKVRI